MDKALAETLFYSDDNIRGIGEGEGGKAVVFVLEDAPKRVASLSLLSDKIEIIKVKGFGIGPPYWPDKTTSLAYKDRRRPVPGGISVGNWRISAGTVSGYVIDNLSGDNVLLSNWHVLSGDSGVIGDDVVQPGIADGGARPGDVVANLLRSVPVHTDRTVFVDCAIAKMKNLSDVDENIIALGKPHGSTFPYIGQWLKKSGRTTETTAGMCGVINASVKVDYGGFSKTIQDCIITGVPSAPGDSGSLMMDYGNKAVALLFAGGMTSDGYLITIGCRADRVEQELNVTFPTPSVIQKRNGIDVSKWQGEMDWQKAKDAGMSVAIIRAGSIDGSTGVPYEDTQFRRNAELAHQYMLTGFYWYFRPNFSAKLQSDYFCDLIRNAVWKVPPVIDIEEHAGMSKSDLASAVWSFANLIEQNLGVRPIIYTSPGFWNSYVGTTTWAKNYPLWVANWVNIGVLYPAIPEDWKGVIPVMWQYRVLKGGGSIYGAQSTDIDLDVTYPDFEKILVGSTPPPPPPPPGKVRLTVNVSGSGSVTVSPDTGGEYDVGTSVSLTAVPDNGWTFVRWEGAVFGTNNPISLVMDSDKTVTAVFVEEDELATGVHYYGVVTVNGLRIRTDAGTSNSIVGTLTLGQRVEILESKRDNLGNDWVRIGQRQWSAQYYREASGWREYIRYLFADEL